MAMESGKLMLIIIVGGKKKITKKECECLKLFVKNIICGRNCDANRCASCRENPQPIF